MLELRRRPVTTAAQLAEHLEVSVRTIYRDVADLIASGIPIEGEAGVGYRLGHDFELPPLMFTLPEVRALVLGVRMVEAWGDTQLRTAARAVLVTPADRPDRFEPRMAKRGPRRFDCLSRPRAEVKRRMLNRVSEI